MYWVDDWQPPESMLENWRTFHPIYSIYHVGTPLQTKNSRMAQLFLSLSAIAFFNALPLELADNVERGTRVLLYPFISSFIGFFINYVTGIFLYAYYKQFEYYNQEVKIDMENEAKLVVEDRVNRVSYRLIFTFYLIWFVMCNGFFAGAIYIMYDRVKDDQWDFVAQFFLGALWLLVIFEVFFMLVAKL